MSLGDLRVTVLDAGRVWLDGGTMFGVVPKALWAEERAPDADNRIALAMNLLLIEDGKRNILVDTGVGADVDDKMKKIFNLKTVDADELLAPCGLSADRIDTVVDTHLHFDHAGGNVRRDAAGQWTAAFPNAEYVMQRGEVELARLDNERIRASFVTDHFEPLLRDDRVRLVEGDTRLTDEIELLVAPGHTPAMQIVKVSSGGAVLAFLADLVPTSSHVPYGWIMGYDLEPLETLASKKRFLPQALREGWLLVFEHDDRMPLATLDERDGRLVARPAEVEV
jgi:glyoxylase-like metal-dependent hydrolase (beta-lactamase superfamily II)